MRDAYTPKDPDYLRWQARDHVDPAERWPEWIELVSGLMARGVVVRRARVVSEPVTDYIRYEHGLTDCLNIASGELVRWLPRRRASAGVVDSIPVSPSGWTDLAEVRQVGHRWLRQQAATKSATDP